MRNIRTLTLGSLVAVGGFLGGSINVAWGQSACIMQCRDKGWAQGQCSTYCASRYGAPDYNRRSSAPSGPGVYGYFGGGVGGNCGQYKYIKDGGCADARTDPPGLR